MSLAPEVGITNNVRINERNTLSDVLFCHGALLFIPLTVCTFTQTYCRYIMTPTYACPSTRSAFIHAIHISTYTIHIRKHADIAVNDVSVISRNVIYVMSYRIIPKH